MVFKFWQKDDPHNIILMDLDGALSPLSKVEEPHKTVDIGWKTLHIPNRLVALLSFLEGKAEVVWSSVWMELSNEVNKTLDIEEYDYLIYENPNSFDTWTKHQRLLEFVDTHDEDNILIIDDEIPQDSPLRNHRHVTIIESESHEGLIDYHIDLIIEWLAEHDTPEED